MKMDSKILAVAIVAMFAATAFVAVVGDEADAADKKTFHLYLEVLDEDGKVVFGKWISASGEATIEGYVAAMDPAIKEAVKNSKDIGEVADYGVSPSSYGGIKFNSDSDYWAAVTTNDGGKWAYMTDTTAGYISADSAAVICCPSDIYYDYFYLPELPEGANEKDYIYYEDPWMGGGWHLLPNTSATSYEGLGVMLYVIIAIVVIVVIAGAVFMMKKKKTA